MIIQVVLGQVGKDRRIEPDPFHPALIQGVGRDLHGHRLGALIPEPGQEPL